jgi:hypothetical protein
MMGLRKLRWAVLATLTLILSSQFSIAQAQEGSAPASSGNVELEPEGWLTVAPGFHYRDEHGGISFWISAPELTEAGLQQVGERVGALARAAATELDRFRLGEWELSLARARVMHLNWQILLEILWPRFVRNVEQMVAAGALPPELAGLVRPPHPPSLERCSLGASAMPTTAAPGAKAYATAVCSEQPPIGAPTLLGSVRTKTMATSGSDWPPSCHDEGRTLSQCKTVALGNGRCHSTALAEHYYLASGFHFVSDHRSSSNIACN